MFDRLREFSDSLVKWGLPGLDLSVWQSGREIFRYQSGYRDLEDKLPMTGKERYNIYSCSKPITCTCALQLWEKGLFSLDDPLSDYMPEFGEMLVKDGEGVRRAQSPIRIRHLFEMTAGFSYDLNSPSLMRCRKETEGRCPTREVMRYLAKEPLLFEPGDRWEYSLCHDVLAALVEVLSGEAFADYAKKHIFDPIGMKDASFLISDGELSSIAPQYCFRDGKAVNIGPTISYKLGCEYASGGAGGICTVDDYMRFLEGLRTGRLLNTDTVTLMQTDRLTEHQKRTYWTRETHGYGLGVRCPQAKGHYRDFGWGGAAGAYLAVDTENELSLYLGCHLLSSPVQGIRAMVYRFVLAELFDQTELSRIQKELAAKSEYHLTY